MPNRPTTIKDIAARLNVHHTTVSKALRNHPDIKPATKKLIRQTARDMEYHPNVMAQSFKNRKTNTIGVCVPLINNDFFAEVISGIQNVVYDSGYTMIVCQSNESYDRELLDIKAMISNQVAGLIISISQGTKNIEHLLAVQRRKIPLVMFDRVHSDLKTSRVVINDFDGARIATDYLINKGYRRIAYISGPPHLSICKDRFDGYHAAHKQHHLNVDASLVVYGSLKEQAGIIGTRQLLEQAHPPDAIVCINDPVATGAYVSIKEHELAIPDDIAVVGFGNIRISAFLDPALTTVRQSPQTIGDAAARMLIRQIEGDLLPEEPDVVIIQPELVVRKSA